MNFQEIAFAAEMDRHEPPDCQDEAWLLCGEDQGSTKRNIEELRDMIYERGECQPHRMDSAYLLRFLRARRSIPARAHRLMVRYCNFREQNPYLWRDVDWFGLTKLGNIFEGVLYDRPDCGRLIICRLGCRSDHEGPVARMFSSTKRSYLCLWDPDEFSVEDLLRGALLLLEIGIMQPKLQLLGGTAMLDCQGLTMKHMKHLSPTYALHAINIMGFAFPLHQRGVNVINCSRVFEALFHIFKRLAPADDLWKRVHFHGYDLTSLHRQIHPECLPKRYGGFRQEVSLKLWLTKIKQYKNKDYDDEMRNLGYYVD